MLFSLKPCTWSINKTNEILGSPVCNFGKIKLCFVMGLYEEGNSHYLDYHWETILTIDGNILNVTMANSINKSELGIRLRNVRSKMGMFVVKKDLCMRTKVAK